MIDWQPIDTAPKDGGKILVIGKRIINVAEWFSGCWCCVVNGSVFLEGYDDITVDPQPTHWMPFPDPPNTEDSA